MLHHHVVVILYTGIECRAPLIEWCGCLSSTCVLNAERICMYDTRICNEICRAVRWRRRSIDLLGRLVANTLPPRAKRDAPLIWAATLFQTTSISEQFASIIHETGLKFTGKADFIGSSAEFSHFKAICRLFFENKTKGAKINLNLLKINLYIMK